MGMCKPSGGKIDIIGRIGDLKAIGTPNTREDLYNEDGELLQQRWFGPDGKAILNRDWKHKNKGGEHKFPHDHKWDWNKTPPRQDYTGEDIDTDYC